MGRIRGVNRVSRRRRERNDDGFEGKEGLAPAATSPQEFDAFMRTEMGNFERVIKTLKLKMN